MAISGKDRDLCIRALAAAQGIPDVAFEFLLSGNVPDVAIGDEGAGGDEGYGDEEMGEGDLEGALDQYNLDPSVIQALQTLVSNPSFPMIR